MKSKFIYTKKLVAAFLVAATSISPSLAQATLYEFTVIPEPTPHQEHGSIGTVSYFRANVFNTFLGQPVRGSFGLAVTDGTVRIDSDTGLIEFALNFITTSPLGAHPNPAIIPIGTTVSVLSSQTLNTINVDPLTGTLVATDPGSFAATFDFSNGVSFDLRAGEFRGCTVGTCTSTDAQPYFVSLFGGLGAPIAFSVRELANGSYFLTYGIGGFTTASPGSFWMGDQILDLRMVRTAAEVPEPATMLLLLSGALPCALRKRRQLRE